MFEFFSSKKGSEKLNLPPLGKKGAEKSVADETFGMEDDKDEIDSTTSKDDDNYDYRKPIDFDAWIRAIDEQNTIYFYNVKTGESTWLGPCGTCCKPSNKYCIDCKSAYCDHDFKKRHEKKSRQKHHWQQTDPPNRPKLTKNDVCCIECSLNVATLMCTDCWDPYCPECFRIVHYVGALKHHPTMPYQEAVKGWIKVRGETIKDLDTYTNGTTGVTTYEKPYELMNPLERKLYRTFKRCEAAVSTALNEIEALQFEVEQTKYDRDKTWDDSQAAFRELHTKQVEKTKAAQHGNKLDHSKLKKVGFLAGIFGANAKHEVYRDKLLNPSDRRRGESRSNYIKDVLATAAGIVAEDEEES